MSCLVLTAWCSLFNDSIAPMILWWKCYNTNSVFQTKLCWTKRVASLSSSGVDDHYTSVHVGNREVVGETIEYTNSWRRVPHNSSECCIKPQAENTTNTYIYEQNLLMHALSEGYDRHAWWYAWCKDIMVHGAGICIWCCNTMVLIATPCTKWGIWLVPERTTKVE